MSRTYKDIREQGFPRGFQPTRGTSTGDLIKQFGYHQFTMVDREEFFTDEEILDAETKTLEDLGLPNGFDAQFQHRPLYQQAGHEGILPLDAGQ